MSYSRHIANVDDFGEVSFELFFVCDDDGMRIDALFWDVDMNGDWFISRVETLDYAPVSFEDACDACYQMYGRGAGWNYDPMEE